MKTSLCLLLSLSLTIIVFTNSTPKDGTKAQSVSKNLIGKTMLNFLQSPTGVPISPDDLFSSENITWINNLQDFVGRVVKIGVDKNGKKVIVDILDDLKKDSVKVKVDFKIDFKDENKNTYVNSNVGEISFMGITVGGDFRKEYAYIENTMALAAVYPQQIDKLKIKNEFKCATATNCEYAYINAASVRFCEVRTFQGRSGGGRVSTNQLMGMVAQVSPIDGSIKLSRINEDIKRKHMLFCTVVRIQ